jgi:Uma2 family endonuclease
MTTATKLMSLEEFFAYDDGTDTCYELENGELLTMPPESEINRRIASLLFAYFFKGGILPQYLSMKTEIVVTGTRPTVRFPDLLVLSEAGVQALEGATRSTITLEMPPPRLVVEVVSPGTENVKRDYRYKKSQYEARGIDEYWIVDPIEQKVTVLVRVEGLYESQVFTEEQAIDSPFLKELQIEDSLTAIQVLSGKI